MRPGGDWPAVGRITGLGTSWGLRAWKCSEQCRRAVQVCPDALRVEGPATGVDIYLTAAPAAMPAAVSYVFPGISGHIGLDRYIN